MSEQQEETKIGAGHAEAMARLGLQELRGALYPESNVAQPSEYGLYGRQTPQEIVDSKHEELPEQKESPLADRLQQAEVREDHDRESRTLDKE